MSNGSATVYQRESPDEGLGARTLQKLVFLVPIDSRVYPDR